MNADIPANWAERDSDSVAPDSGILDTLVIVTAPDGRDLNIHDTGGGMFFSKLQSDDIELRSNTNSLVDNLVLPLDGSYQIIVSGAGYRTGGAYTLIIESQPPGAVTPTP